MLNHIKKLLFPTKDKKDLNTLSAENNKKKLQIATCALFVEMANADDNFSKDEKEKIISIMQNTFDLEDDYVEELIEFSEEKAKESVSIYEFTTEINNHFSNDEKYELIKNLWRLIYLDKNLNAYEERLLKKIGGIINLDHQTIIAAKLEVKGELNLNK